MPKKYIPNFITVSRIFLTPVIIVCILKENFKWALILMLMVSISDFGDGFLARRYNSITAFGMKMDAIADKIVGLSIGWFLVITNTQISLMLILLLTVRDIIISVLRYKNIISLNRGSSITAKTKTFLLYLLLCIVISDLSFHFLESENKLYTIFLVGLELIIGFLTVYSFINYLPKKYAYRKN